MKILFFINKLYGGGAERVASILMNHFCRSHSVRAVVFDNTDIAYQINTDISTHEISVKSRFRITRLNKRISTIRKEIKKESPDVIISFLTPINIYVIIANLFTRKKTIISERNTLNREQSKFVRLLRKVTYPFANKIVFVTDADRHKFGLPQKSSTIYNPAIFEPYANYDNRHNTIITIAPIDRWYNKGLDLLVKAWTKIESQYPDWNLEIYGRNNGSILPDAITQLKQERISWEGWNYNIEEILRTKSIFILASRYEGCPNSLIEAMSQGCACIGTNCEGGIKEMITDGVDGIIAQSENVDDIADKLQMLINDNMLRRKLSAGALEKTRQFDKNSFFAKWDKLIDEVTAK
ncbi:MAG: glycosyltransferase [Salinivirgaceae bacterium]|nr:glycosyltransferase [Salinivirgaceae bacterium]MBR4621164.1 glycosyltransferase [Salinivirgaceae bacterium]